MLESSQTSRSASEVIQECGFKNHEEFQTALRQAAKKPSVVLKRDEADCYCNGYSPVLLRAWNGNLDIQYVTDAYSCVTYILSYISKSEHEMSEILKQARDELRDAGRDSDLRKQMKALGSVYFDNREVSVQEAVVRVCGLPMKDCSRNVTFIPTNEHNIRMSLPFEKIKQKKEAGETDIWMPSLYEKYLARPLEPEFDVMCQAGFVADFRFPAKAESTNAIERGNINLHQLQNELGYILKRTRGKPAIIRYTRFSKTNDPEKYYLTFLKLYLPHRSENQLKPTGYVTYQNFYENGAVQLIDSTDIRQVADIVSENEKRFTRGGNELQEAMNYCST